MSTTQEIAEQLVQLLPGFFHLRPRLIVPEHVAHFKEQMESLKNSGVVNFEDRPMLFRILLLLSNSTAAPTMGELSAELGIPLSSATRLVDGLVNANFIERTNDPHDRRVVRIQMSDYGKQFSQTAMEYIRRRITTLLENFTTAEQEQLLQLMTKLFKSMEAER